MRLNRFLVVAASAALVLTGAVGCSKSKDDKSSETTTAEEAGTRGPSTRTDKPDLITGAQVGACSRLEDLQNRPETFPAVSCDESHDVEVIHVIALDGDEMPSVADLEERGLRECRAAVADYVGEPYEDAGLRVYWMRPTEKLWDDGIHTMPCLAVSEKAVEGSIKGSA